MSPEPDAHSRSENDTVVRFEAINPGPTLSAEALDAYCAREGIRLPEPLRQQLLEQNAGAPRSECYVTLPGGREEEVFSFFGVDMPDRSSELGWIARTFVGRLPARMLPFADDPAGNLSSSMRMDPCGCGSTNSKDVRTRLSV
jgi:hypothetical protein